MERHFHLYATVTNHPNVTSKVSLMKIDKRLYRITDRLSLRNTLTIGALVLWLALGGGAGALASDDPPNRPTRPAAVLEQNVQSDTGLLLSLAAGGAKFDATAQP